MADNRIAGLSAITEINTALDFIPIVDVSDPQMANSGTTKKITINQILAAGTNLVVPAGTAGAPSISFSGDSNTGIYAPAADQLSISSGGSGNATVSSTGLSVTGSVSATSTITGTQLISTLATGTAPLSINSTTLVSNLNADLLDGQHGTYYQDASNITAGTLAVTRGGTGILSYAIGDLIYASAATTLAKLASVASGSVLVSGGVATAPSWGKVELDIHVSKILPIANGGTGAATFTAGQILYGSGTSALGSSANLFWDSTNSRLGLGTATPNYKLEVVGATDSAGISLTTAYGAAAEKYAALRFTNSSFGGGHSEIRNVVNGSVSLGSSLTFWTAAGATGNIAERLRIASDGNVGIGTTTPNRKLEVAAGTGGAALRLTNTNGNSGIEILTASDKTSWRIGAQYNVDHAFEITPSTAVGGTTFSTPAVVVTSSGNVGIGTTSPSVKVQVDNNGQSEVRIRNTSGSGIAALALVAGAQQSNPWYLYADSSRNLIFQDGGSDRARIDSTGNLGLGVTPSAHSAGRTAFQSPAGVIEGAAGELNILNNAFLASGGWTKINNAAATMFRSTGAEFKWYNAGTGTGVFTWTQAMTLDASGNLGIGTTTPDYPLTILTPTSDTNVGFNLRAYTTGVDGARTVSSRYTTSNNGSWANSKYQASAHIWEGDGAERMRLTAGGNLGLGVTPKAWNGNYRAIQIGLAGAIFNDNFNEDLNVSSNAYYDSTDNRYEFIRTGYAQRYTQTNGGQHRWYTSTSAGNADTAITFTQAMTLTAAGSLAIGQVGSSSRVTIQAASSGNDLGISNANLPLYLKTGGGSSASVRNMLVGHLYTGSDTDFSASQIVLISANNVSAQSAAIALTSNNALAFYTAGTNPAADSVVGTERLRIKSTGQVNFTGLASDPAGAAGDVYYNSASNKLKFYDSAWKTIPASDQVSVANGTAAAPSISFDSDTDTGVYRIAANTIGITTGGVTAVRVNPTGSFGYSSDVGGTVTQTISRTTGVTLSKPCGSITLVSAAGSTAWQTFTVTNTVVEPTDVIRVCQQSGTDLYQIHVTNVSNNSFKITFATTGGTTTEQPVFNFVVIKSSAGAV